ncbi:arylsulfatase A family protein [Chthonomonas calidirosea]|uniref:sulfatase n=1 Tax=Chthonomonas calidirosea TaxID=454171 RepID=UPI0006DD45A0|nr:sulfatase [Chthonomonas calidirosea]CEK18976.1 arylsulfatase A family protein [Chthonomonas calidirosea]
MTNVILISLDTTRADHLSCYGYHRKTSPHLDQIAAEGVLFTDFFSPHIPTFPGHTTMMTGKDIYAHQITSQATQPEPAQGVRMLAEILREQGFFTAAADNLGRWFARGFEYIEPYGWDTSNRNELRKGEAVLAAALRVLTRAANQDEPFFLFFHFWDPHTPYLPPPPFSRMFYAGDEKAPNNPSMDAVWEFEAFNRYFAEWMPDVTDIEFPKAQYDAEIAYLDTCLAHLMTHLDALGLSEDTCLVITADHGEELDEHGCWFDHHGLYDTNVHIPLILRCPALLPAGVRIGGLTQMLDLAPTILDILGLSDLAEREGMMGRSLIPLIHSPSSTQRGTTDWIHLTENTWMKKRGIRTATWKLIVPLEIPDLHGRSEIELYDLTNDPGELTNVANTYPEVTEQLKAKLESWVARRVEETGLPDPLPIQPIPLRRIGRMDAALPRDKRLTGEEKEPTGDEKQPEGDFIGYERDETKKTS